MALHRSADATGTLRLTYGTIAGYAEGNTNVPAFTDFAGMFDRWADRKGDPAFARCRWFWIVQPFCLL